MVTFDVLAFLLASLRAWRTIRHDAKFWSNPRASINYAIFSQGLIYILPVFLLSVTTLSLNWKLPVLFVRTFNALKLPLAGLLTARFLIKLRIWEDHRRQHETRSLEVDTYNASTFEDGMSASLPVWNVPGQATHSSQGSVLDELGADIGPGPDEIADIALRERDRHDEPEEVPTPTKSPHTPDEEMGEVSKRRLSIWKGKQRAVPNDREVAVVAQ
ncbi:hypothetical protein CC1G_09058 [Coprinopsis cinerea okayama7|uniref:Uncharacterized protein n=1 Tax=Coprinopsis cinerea (strain Okayama-7 / 130 / ATCC MYA-4618 / FGSC 9003) TaxID=240176 RepID=A8P2Z2_COPC7|nr:hypothetical protein CC1G_09058 [Coprinopsis cinerea okayama7\|eukprot:XP_001838430.2 hypothetical protein CC1G_09058 [Coprinopsis cinerea okayama7\